MDMMPPRVIEDLDEAMGELLHLFGTAGQLQRVDKWGLLLGPMPHQIDPALYAACVRVVNAQPFELALECFDLLFSVYLPEGNRIARDRSEDDR